MSSVSSSGVSGLDHGDTDGRMGDGIEVGPGGVIGEGHGGQGGTVDGPVGGHDAGPEAIDQRLVGRSAGRHHLTGHLIGINQHGAPGHQEFGHGRLPRADSPGQPHRQHQASGGGGGETRGCRATARRTSVVSSRSSVTNQSSAVIPVTPPASPRATSL